MGLHIPASCLGACQLIKAESTPNRICTLVGEVRGTETDTKVKTHECHFYWSWRGKAVV